MYGNCKKEWIYGILNGYTEPMHLCLSCWEVGSQVLPQEEDWSTYGNSGHLIVIHYKKNITTNNSNWNYGWLMLFLFFFNYFFKCFLIVCTKKNYLSFQSNCCCVSLLSYFKECHIVLVLYSGFCFLNRCPQCYIFFYCQTKCDWHKH